MPDLNHLLDQSQSKIDDLENWPDWGDNNRVIEAMSSVVADAEAMLNALQAVIKIVEHTREQYIDYNAADFIALGIADDIERALNTAMKETHA